MVKWRENLIVCALGYGYLSKYVFKRLCSLGVIGLGITSKQNSHESLQNIFISNRDKTNEAISLSSHLLITASPEKMGCPIFNNFSRNIAHSNIRSIVYISSSGVYGNHLGDWVYEESNINANSSFDKFRLKAENQWKNLCKRNNLKLNIIRVAGIYGPERIKKFNKENIILVKKNHYFSRIHIYDIARLVTKILLESNSNQVWNLADDNPSTREDFLKEVIRLKGIKKYKIMKYSQHSLKLSEKAKKFWLNNKKVSNQKVKKFFKYRFIFPSFKSGLKNLKEYL